MNQVIDNILSKFSVFRYGFATLGTPATLPQYDNWLANNYYGEMDYLKRHRDTKSNLSIKYPHAQSAIVIAYNYVPHPSLDKNPFPHLRVALYAQGMDYHDWLKVKLEEIVSTLKLHFPDETFWICTDSSPVLERDLARQAGLGWFGKNTCLIERKTGSYFFISEILTTLPVKPSAPSVKTFCGTCTRCIDACPTGALLEPHVLDARKCTSYLTIESKATPPPELRGRIGNHFFGCDICQTVCPWNEELKPYEFLPAAIEELRFILKATDEELKNKIKGTAMERAKPFGLKRNALIVAGNEKIQTLKAEIETYLDHSSLGELADWSLKAITHHGLEKVSGTFSENS